MKETKTNIKKTEMEEYLKSLNCVLKPNDEYKNTAKVYIEGEVDEEEYVEEVTYYYLSYSSDLQQFKTFLDIYAKNKKKLFESHFLDKLSKENPDICNNCPLHIDCSECKHPDLIYSKLEACVGIPYFDNRDACHTITKVRIIYCDENGTSYEII